jgi:hypothetical protein
LTELIADAYVYFTANSHKSCVGQTLRTGLPACSEVPAIVKDANKMNSTIICCVTLCSLVEDYQRFGGKNCLHVQSRRLNQAKRQQGASQWLPVCLLGVTLRTWGWRQTFLRKYALPDHTASHPRRILLLIIIAHKNFKYSTYEYKMDDVYTYFCIVHAFGIFVTSIVHPEE